MFKSKLNQRLPRLNSNSRRQGMKLKRKPGSGGSRRMGTPTLGNILTGRKNNNKKMY